jgi:hypothetical protein
MSHPRLTLATLYLDIQKCNKLHTVDEGVVLVDDVDQPHLVISSATSTDQISTKRSCDGTVLSKLPLSTEPLEDTMQVLHSVKRD